VLLIFLDTPQISLLEEKRRTEPLRYSSFCDSWKRSGCILVFTSAQAGETTRYGDASRREGRYRVLADLAPVRTDFLMTRRGPAGPQTLIEREILRAIVERGLVTPTGSAVDQLAKWTEVLPGRLNAGEVPLLGTVMESEEYRDVENQMFNAARFAAGAEKAAGKSRAKGRVRDLSSTPLSEKEAAECSAGFENAITLLNEESRQGKLPPIPEGSLRAARDSFRRFISRAQEIGTRATTREYLPIVGLSSAEQLRLQRHDLVNRSVFEKLVRIVARTILDASESEQEFVARTLDFADCPGTWLERRLRLWVERSSSEPKPSHHNDAARLAYLPYVDVLFTDAEMAESVRQIQEDPSSPKPIRELRPPTAISSSLEELERSLGFLGIRKAEATN